MCERNYVGIYPKMKFSWTKKKHSCEGEHLSYAIEKEQKMFNLGTTAKASKDVPLSGSLPEK